MDDANDLYDDIKASMEATEDTTTEVTKEPTDRVRDETGKFAKSDEVAAAAKLDPSAKTEKEPSADDSGAPKEPAKEGLTLSEDRAPRGWSPAAREKWNTIPEDLRHEIMRREEASAQGVRQLQEGFAPAQQFLQSIDPVVREAVSMGMSPNEYIFNMAASERTLRTASVPDKFQEILRIADQYGVPLREVVNASVGQEVLGKANPQQQQQQMQIPPELMQELQAMRQWREEQQSSGTTNEIKEFAKNNEFFGDVNNVMASLFDSGAATSLQEAYDMACWGNPEIRAILMGRPKESDALSEKQKTAAGASIRPGGKVPVGDGDDEDDDLHDTISKAFSKSVNARV